MIDKFLCSYLYSEHAEKQKNTNLVLYEILVVAITFMNIFTHRGIEL